MEIKKICRSPFPLADHANFGDLTLLLFCRASLRNVQSFKKHELSNRLPIRSFVLLRPRCSRCRRLLSVAINNVKL